MTGNEARREYQRKWNREHKEKRKEYTKRYWERKAGGINQKQCSESGAKMGYEMAAVHVALSISKDFDRIHEKLEKLQKELEGTGIAVPSVQEVLALENKFCELARVLWDGGYGDGKQ